MVKSIILPIIVFCLYGCISVTIPRDKTLIISKPKLVEPIEPEIIESVIPVIPVIIEPTSKECLEELSDSFLGTREIGKNEDFTNPQLKELLIEAGWKKGLAWCSFMVKGLLDHCNIPNTITGWSPSSYNKKDVIFTDGSFKKEYSEGDIIVMSLSYNKFKNNKSRYKGIGHTGIVRSIGTQSVTTDEGNTSEQPSDINQDRDGQFYTRRIRPLTSNVHLTRWKKE